LQESLWHPVRNVLVPAAALPGAADLLRACRHRGLAVVLASSADEPEFKALRAALDAEDAIDAATFAGDVESAKPAPDLVRAALERVGVRAQEAVFIGDTAWEVQACQKAEVPCIGLLSGGISGDELLAAGAAEVYRGPADLLTALPDRHGGDLGRPAQVRGRHDHNGSLPPSSSTTFLVSLPATAATDESAGPDPVSVAAATRGSRRIASTRAEPTSRVWKVPAGTRPGRKGPA
jgi:Haloacid dehalogenase-like hydrolase